MRQNELALDLPELAHRPSPAHDFAQIAGGRRTVQSLSHAAKRSAVRPAVGPSRFRTGGSRVCRPRSAGNEGQKKKNAPGGKLCSFARRNWKPGPDKGSNRFPQGRAKPPGATNAAANCLVNDGDRGNGARSLHDLCQVNCGSGSIRSIPSTMPLCRRPPTRGSASHVGSGPNFKQTFCRPKLPDILHAWTLRYGPSLLLKNISSL